MSFIDRFRGALRGAFATKASAVARHIAIGAAGTAVWTPRRSDLLAREAYVKNGIAYRCVDEIAKGASQAAILVYQVAADGSRREAPDHPVAKLLRRPNPTQSRTRLIHEVASHLAINGNAYIEGVGPQTGGRRGQFLELWAKRPDRMKVVPGPQGVAAYVHEVHGNSFTWEVDPLTYRAGIKHLRLFHPLDDWYGLSPIEVAAMDVDTHNQTREWNQALLQNAARPEGALTTEKRLTDVQFARLKEEIRQKYSGPQNAGRPLLLEDGLQWQQFSFSPKDMDFLESKHTTARDVCTVFGVPPMLLGIPGDNTYSNQREARVAFFDTTVVFYLQLIVEELGAWLLGDDDPHELGYDLDTVPAMAYRREQLFERATKATFLTINEQREMAGFGKLAGEDGDVLLVSTTLRPLEQALEPPPAPAAPGAAADPKKPAKKPKPDEEDPDREDGDKAARVAALRAAPATLKAARAELGCTQAQFALWLVTEEGLGDEDAAALAALTGD